MRTKLFKLMAALVIILGLVGMTIPVAASAPAQAECRDGDTIGNMQNTLTRTPIGMGEYATVSEISFKPGKGFEDFGRYVLVVGAMHNEYQAFALNTETVHMLSYCGDIQAVKAYAAQADAHVRAMVQTAMDTAGNKPHPDEIGVYYVDMSTRQLVTLRPAPLGPHINEVMAHIQVVDNVSGLVIGLAPVTETQVPGTTQVVPTQPATPTHRPTQAPTTRPTQRPTQTAVPTMGPMATQPAAPLQLPSLGQIAIPLGICGSVLLVLALVFSAVMWRRVQAGDGGGGHPTPPTAPPAQPAPAAEPQPVSPAAESAPVVQPEPVAQVTPEPVAPAPAATEAPTQAEAPAAAPEPAPATPPTTGTPPASPPTP